MNHYGNVLEKISKSSLKEKDFLVNFLETKEREMSFCFCSSRGFAIDSLTGFCEEFEAPGTTQCDIAKIRVQAKILEQKRIDSSFSIIGLSKRVVSGLIIEEFYFLNLKVKFLLLDIEQYEEKYFKLAVEKIKQQEKYIPIDRSGIVL